MTSDVLLFQGNVVALKYLLLLLKSLCETLKRLLEDTICYVESVAAHHPS